MMKIKLAGTAALLVGLVVAGTAPANAQTSPTVLGTEDFSAGLIVSLPGGQGTVASDGEFNFFPFGATFDVSDAIQLNQAWAQDPASTWTQITGTDAAGGPPNPFTWVLPANLTGIGCGAENEPTCEPVGKWYTVSGQQFNIENPLIYTILEADGSWSDTIILANNGPGGAGAITFISDPTPLPSTWTMMLIGLAALGFVAYRTRKQGVRLAAA